MKPSLAIFGTICIAITTINCQELSYVAFRDFENVLIKLVVSLARGNQFDDARRELKKLEDYEGHMSTVITQVYAGNYTNTERCVEMLYSINCDAYAIGALALYQAIKSSGHLTKPETLMFANQLDQPDCVQTPNINETIALMKPHVDTILTEWAANIRNGKYDNIYRFVEFSDEQYNSFSRHIPVLVKKAMRKDAAYFNATLAFVKDLPFLRFIAPGYMTLIQELKGVGKNHSEEMLQLTYRLHETMMRRAEILGNFTDLEATFSKVKTAVPPVLQNLFWKETCTIKNLFWKEYLHAAKEPRQGGNGVVFTWITGFKVTAAEWLFFPEFVDGKLYFQVKNKQLDDDDYLLCESLKTQKVVTCNGEGEQLTTWLVMPTAFHEISTAFRLKNANTNMKSETWGLSFFATQQQMQPDFDAMSFLQASQNYDLGMKRREVLDSFEENSSHWQIDCV